MNLIVLIGSGAVGKMTVGQELMKITDYRLFHNHHMIEPVIEIFGKFDGAVVGKLREDIFDAFLKTDYSGLIFTYMWAFDMQSDWDYIKSVTDKFEGTGGNVYYVELVADRAVRIERNKTENRLKNKASKRDIVVSEDRMLREETKYRLVSNDGEIPFENYMKIDNTNLEPSEVALMIKERFNLQGIRTLVVAGGAAAGGIWYYAEHSGNPLTEYADEKYNADLYRAEPFSETLCVSAENVALDGFTDEPSLHAAGLFNLNERSVEYGYRLYDKLYPASTTKLMTAYLALKYGKLEDMVTVTDSVTGFAIDEVVCGLYPGGQVKLYDLLCGLLLKSGNDCGVAIAEYISGSVEAFAELMNEEAK